MEIHKGLGNANKMMNRILYTLHMHHQVQVASIDGGGLRNAIPRESIAIIASGDDIKGTFDQVARDISLEYKTTEPNLSITLDADTGKQDVLPGEVQDKLLAALYAAHNGVYKMSADFDDLVETSNNVARVLVRDGRIEILCLTRSSVESSKQDLVQQLAATFRLMDAQVSTGGDYPGWTPNPDSRILKVMKENYQKTFGDHPEVVACHAGLECGIIAGNYPDLDMISFGPTILGAHSPDERASISSVGEILEIAVSDFSHNIILKKP
ncbi:MAG: M20/M25/M40 family metallo-hydrolase [Taibaiella sp.]|nr:M20/M25/M40 family metallo-hydrolase [Taibaiella sp.]